MPVVPVVPPPLVALGSEAATLLALDVRRPSADEDRPNPLLLPLLLPARKVGLGPCACGAGGAGARAEAGPLARASACGVASTKF